jgi:DNA-binding NtrC family response regulator
VAEDQTFIALDLCLAIEDAGGEVVGPAASVEEALALLASTTVAGAILDVSLADGNCSAPVEILVGRNVPMILQTGVGLPAELASRFPGLIVHIKPCVAAKLVAQLETLIADAESAAATAGSAV